MPFMRSRSSSRQATAHPVARRSGGHRTAAQRWSNAALAALVALGTLGVAGCATPGTGDPRDPLEPLNRGIYEFNEAVDRTVIRPVAEAYVAVLPPVARTGVSNFFGNLYDYWNVINNLLQGKVGTAFSDAGRIALNTTVGLLGFVDVASRVGLEKSDEDLGQTLGWWGIGHGPYLVLPLIGPSSLRDGTGTIAEILLDPQTRWIDDNSTVWALWGLRLVNVRANLLGAGRIFDQAASDRYAFLRDAYFQRRRSQLWDGNPPRERESARPQPSVVQLPAAWTRPDPNDGSAQVLPLSALQAPTAEHVGPPDAAPSAAGEDAGAS